MMSFATERGQESSRKHVTLAEEGVLLASGGAADEDGAGLKSVTLRFPRCRDAEFLALTALLGNLRRAASEAGASWWDARGRVQLRISQTPCLSCVSAMIQ